MSTLNSSDHQLLGMLVNLASKLSPVFQKTLGEEITRGYILGTHSQDKSFGSLPEDPPDLSKGLAIRNDKKVSVIRTVHDIVKANPGIGRRDLASEIVRRTGRAFDRAYAQDINNAVTSISKNGIILDRSDSGFYTRYLGSELRNRKTSV